VVLVLPAKTRAAEAFVYAALVEMQTPQKKCELAGGWTQTSPRPSPLCCLLIKETKRNLDRECFKCGGDHFAQNCASKLLQPTCWYPCKNCGEKLYLTSRGQTPKPKAGEDSFLSCERGDPQPDQQAAATAAAQAQATREKPRSSREDLHQLQVVAEWEEQTDKNNSRVPQLVLEAVHLASQREKGCVNS
jgi:hypothetical protein